jgi:hypothetical protein
MAEPRECRLRPEYAKVYEEELPSGRWIPAREVAEILVRRASTARRLGLHQRTLDPRHFEFRGSGLISHSPGHRTRRGDRAESGSRSDLTEST